MCFYKVSASFYLSNNINLVSALNFSFRCLEIFLLLFDAVF